MQQVRDLPCPKAFEEGAQSEPAPNIARGVPPSGGTGWVHAGQALPPLAPVHKAQVNLKKLLLDENQKLAIKELYNTSQNIEFRYQMNDLQQQQHAGAKLQELELDQKCRSNLDNRWTAQHSFRWGQKQEQRRTLFQCSCGYHVQARQQQEANKGVNRKKEDWERRVPYPFTACPAHIEITERLSDGAISRIAGINKHNAHCQVAVLERIPPIPLHDHVYEVALEQLRNGASLTAIQEMNRKMIETKAYRDLKSFDPKTANVRYLFLPTDHTSLYRKASKELGYDPKVEPQYNVDDWLNVESQNFKPEIAEAVFHYSARAEAGDRFEICISTLEMDECAYKYAHHSQLVLDGTFGVCSSRLLLFIALSVDEDNKGFPIALFLFSAETGAKATHASYNTAILEKLIRTWKRRLDTKFGSFEPYSAITDTDTKERGALCWTNHRKKVLRCKASEFWKNHARDLLQKLEVDLIATVDYSVATNLLTKHQNLFDNLAVNLEAKRVCEAGLEHIRYLQNYWMSRPLWESWSECGRLAAAARIGIPIEGIIPTTNHLESFNAVLKRKYLPRYLRSGHRLRFDALILLLITQILPQIYHRRNAQREYRSWLVSRFHSSAGGQDLLLVQRRFHAEQNESARLLRCICWWPLDEERQKRALELLHLQRLGAIRRQDSSSGIAYIAQCNPTSGPTPYDVSISTTGIGSCSCGDFYNNGKACKHLRALRLVIDSWVVQGLVPTPFYYPPTLETARNIQQLATKVPSSSTEVLLEVLESERTEAQFDVDWTILQAFGGDTTALGGVFDEELPENTGEANADGCSVSSEDSDDSVEITSVFPQAGITAQIMDRLAHEAKFLLPRLYGVQNTLSDLDAWPTSPELSELEVVIENLASQFSLLRNGTPSVVPPSANLLPVSGQSVLKEHTSPGRLKRKHRLLRAPSPEAMQKRKVSNSTM
ncbi:uncharacterized protein C8R40DRAFT_1175790 [Lentinula edodes]|uniref:uncharacterized protein n=1 Tax=Lentinula edodes TaxID=5353 RepID=UPI001E8E9F0A|nr:uncharacterized protein C8R40DRAFT_1175790 [Lentinula edodes]KAH7870309.1 hypothetical protein C8R40DRAFT_1175790 [Lentinula edodes]